MLLGFGGFLLWGLLAPLDKGVPVSGSVVVAGNRKAVQHPSGGVVSQIQVHEGDRVSAGQVLLLMDTVDSRTQRDALRSQQLSNAAQRRGCRPSAMACRRSFSPLCCKRGGRSRR